jgi:hypothetical protein
MLHWSSSMAEDCREIEEGRADDATVAHGLVSRVVTHLGATIRHFQRQASLRADTFGWDDALRARGTGHGARDTGHHARDAGQRGMSTEHWAPGTAHRALGTGHSDPSDTTPLPLSGVEPPAPDYDSWLIDDPRR